MLSRCYQESSKSYPRYGGRGISVCDAWRNSFLAYLADVGQRPDGMTLDRIDNNGNYEPSNVRWATYKEQSRNKANNRLHTIDGVTRCITEWCEILNEPWTSVKKRMAAGRDPFDRRYKLRFS